MSGTYWLLGLPFDAVSFEEARDRIFAAVGSRRRLVFATPNVSFLAEANRNPRFREDVLQTGLSLVDGMPVVWLGRLLGAPFRERVAGSDLLESLLERTRHNPLRVYFFGGEQGAAEAAMHAVNQRGAGLVGVGAYYPGFVRVELMGDVDVIDSINRSGADLLVVALGAAKGHRWIEANKVRLNVPVISHLGAAINFIANRHRRAPRVLRRFGLEWVWRIREEPALLRRYLRDGCFLIGACTTFVLPQLLRRIFVQHRSSRLCVIPRSDGRVEVTVSGRFGNQEIARLAGDEVAVLRLEDVRELDPAGAGWLYARCYREGVGAVSVIAQDSRSVATLTRWKLLDVIDARDLLAADRISPD